jgi:hypothetical protein
VQDSTFAFNDLGILVSGSHAYVSLLRNLAVGNGFASIGSAREIPLKLAGLTWVMMALMPDVHQTLLI